MINILDKLQINCDRLDPIYVEIEDIIIINIVSFTVVKSFDAIKYNWIFHKLQILYILLDIVHVYESRMKATMSHELKF